MSDAAWSTLSPLPGMTPDELQLAAPASGGKPIIMFHSVQVKDNYQSEVQQRPVFREVTHIKKIVPGDRLLVIDRKIRQADKDEFPLEWARWQQTKSNRMPGVPIENWHSITETQKAEFRALNIFTIEQFAGLPDSAQDRIMGFHELRAKARVFVESGKDAEMVAKIKADSQKEIGELRDQIAELTKLIMDAETSKKPEKVKA